MLTAAGRAYRRGDQWPCVTLGSRVTLGTMTGSKWALTPPLTGIAARDVVAGLLGLAGTHAVARAAAQEAASRGARVRFVHLVPDGTDPAQRDEADNASFAAALRALREFPRVPVTFEIAEGDPVLRHARRAVSDGRIVEVSRSCYRHDRFTVYLQLADR